MENDVLGNASLLLLTFGSFGRHYFQSLLKLFSLVLFERQQVKLKACPFPLILLELAFPKRERTSTKTDTNLSTMFIFVLSLRQMLEGRCLTGKTATVIPFLSLLLQLTLSEGVTYLSRGLSALQLSVYCGNS